MEKLVPPVYLATQDVLVTLHLFQPLLMEDVVFVHKQKWDRQDLQALKEHPADQDNQEAPDLMAAKAHQVLLDRLDQPEIKAQTAALDHRDLPASRELSVRKAPMDQKDPVASQDRKDHQANLVLRHRMDNQALLVLLAPMETLAHLENLARLDHLDHLDHQEPTRSIVLAHRVKNAERIRFLLEMVHFIFLYLSATTRNEI